MRPLVLMVLLSAAALPLPARADLPCPVNLPGCGFSVSGKRGPYTATLDLKQIERDGAAITTPANGAKGFADQSINQGQFSGYGLLMPKTTAALEAVIARLKAKPQPGTPESPGAVNRAKIFDTPDKLKIYMIGDTAYGPKSQVDDAIVVPIGFLQRAESDDEVAWVLAHELSHIKLRHFARSAALAENKRSLESLVNVALLGLEASETKVEKNGQGYSFYTNGPEVAKKSQSAWARAQSVRVAMDLNDQSASRTQEDQADAAGVDMAILANYDVSDGMAHAMAVVDEDDQRLAARLGSLQTQIERAAKDAVDAKTVAQVGNGNAAQGVEIWLKNLKDNLIKLAAAKVMETMTGSHRPAMQRRKGLIDYMDQAWPNAPAPAPTTTWLDRVRNSGEFKEASAVVTAHDKALDLLEAGEPQKALAEIKPVQSTRLGGTAYLLDVEARCYDAMGNEALADQTFDRAEGHAPTPQPARGGKKKAAPPSAPVETDNLYTRQSMLGYADHVKLLVSHGKFAKAKSIIEHAKTIYGDTVMFLPSIIFMAMKDNKPDIYLAAISECRKTENETLMRQCRYAVFDENQRAKLANMSPQERADMDKSLGKLDNMANHADFIKALPVAPAKSPG